MLTGEQLWNRGNWIMKALLEKKRRQERNPLKRLLDKERYGIDDYDVRKKGDHFESYNKITGESLFEAYSEEEAYADLREEFSA